MTTFEPKNKRFYTGRLAGHLMARAGQPCTVKGSVMHAASQTKSRKEETWIFIRFANCALDFMVRPVDIREETR